MARLYGPNKPDDYTSGMAKTVVPRFKPQRRPNHFKAWRKFRGYTLERAAELAGMSIGNISAMGGVPKGTPRTA